MKLEVNFELLRVLPVHDSEVISVEIVPVKNGDVRVCLLLKLHPGESLFELLKMGTSSRNLRVVFEKSWQAAFNVLGNGNRNETIDDWTIIQNSELAKRMLADGFAKGIELHHHQIRLSGGSCLNVLAEKACIEEFDCH